MGAWVIASDWHREDVKAALRKLGLTFVRLAATHGCSPDAFRKTLLRPSHRIEAIIAARLGVAPRAIWPSRYDGTGDPIVCRKHAGARRGRQRQKPGRP